MKKMTNYLFVLGLALALTPLLSVAQSNANPPGQISYQGFLTDANGSPLATNAPRNYTLIFRLWDNSTGGSNLWAEQQVVTVDRGYFTVMLGVGSSVGAPFTNNLAGLFSGGTASDRYIGITATDLSPNEIVPRLRLLASPYSFLASKAMSVDGSALNSGTVADARLSANVALRAGGNAFTGNQTVTSGNVGIGTTSPGFPLNFASTLGDKIALYGNSGSHYGLGIQGGQLQIHADVAGSDIVFGYGQSTAFTETMRVKGSGFVGIANSAPETLLQVGSYGSPDESVTVSTAGGNQYRSAIKLRHFNSGYGWTLVSDERDNTFRVISHFADTNGTTRMLVDRFSGFVGIGTAGSAQQMLQVGDSSIAGSQGMIRLASRTSSGGGAARAWDIGVPQTGDVTTGVGYSFVINDVGNGKTPFMVQYGSGNVGVGTNGPIAPLHVFGGGAVPTAMIDNNSTIGTWLDLRNTGGGTNWIVFSTGSGNGEGAGKLVFEAGPGPGATTGIPALALTPAGRVGVGTVNPANLLVVGNSGSPAYCNGTTWVNGSDRNAKEDFTSVDPRAVLDKVSALPISEWKYKVEADGTRHLGPVAQDFHAAFGLNGQDETHIATVDESGVALAAIKGLNEKLETGSQQAETRIQRLETENAELKARLERLERLLDHDVNGQAR